MKKLSKIISVILCIVLSVCMIEGGTLTSFATAKSEVDRLKKQQASDAATLKTLTSKISELSKKISQQNAKIDSINAKISANNAEIKKNQQETEKDKLEFKKRIRSIYMSNSESTVKVLLGSKSFSQFLQLSQLTSSVSSHDKKLMEDLAEKIRVLNEKNEENTNLLAEQKAIKASLDKDYSDLASQQNKAQSIYNKTTNDLKAAEAAYKREQEEMARRAAAAGGDTNPSPLAGTGTFIWPSKFYYVSAGYKSNDNVHKGKHDGIDIAGSNIMGSPIYAIASGTVSYVYNSCTHNYKKTSGGCGCGGNYGNYCQITHDGAASGFSSIYAHATSIIVSKGQHVKQGQVIGYVGTTGWSTGPHLHFGLYAGGSPVNPLKYLG